MISQGDYNCSDSPEQGVGCQPRQGMESVSNTIIELPTERTPFSVFNVKMAGDSNAHSENIQSNIPLFYTNLDIRLNKNYLETPKVQQSQPNMHDAVTFSSRPCFEENKIPNDVFSCSNTVGFNNHAFKPFVPSSIESDIFVSKENSCHSFGKKSQMQMDCSFPYSISRPQVLTDCSYRPSHCNQPVATNIPLSRPITKQQAFSENPYTSYLMSRPHIPRDISYSKSMNISYALTDSSCSSQVRKSQAQLESPCSNSVTMSQSDSSMPGESTLGTTLAQSLKLISTSNLPLAQSPVRTPSPKTQAVLLHPQTPVAAPRTPGRDIPTAEKTFVDLSPIAEGRRYKTRTCSSDKKTSSSQRKESVVQVETEEGRPGSAGSVPSKDSSVTLFQCEECFKMFNRKQTLRQHFITHTDRFPCPYCKVRCKSKGDLRTHIQTHTKEKPYHCNVCNTNYTRESILKKHQTTQTHKKAVAALGKTSNSTTEAVAIQEPVFSEVKFDGVPCNNCGKAFLTWAELRKHQKLHILKFKCKWCNKRCRSSTLLKFHMKSHGKRNTLTCKLCSRSFPNHFLMKEHTRAHARMKSEMTKEVSWKSLIERNFIQGVSPHDTQQREKSSAKRGQRAAKWSCRMCSKVYINKKSLENHEKVHHCHCCSVCDKRFPTLSKLKMHMKHHGKPYTCELCESPFFDQAEFKSHVEKYHNREDDLKCKICYKEFDCAADLQFHMQNHAPTMLFSGACLDESSIPVHKNKKPGASGSGAAKVSDSESSSENDDDEVDTRKRHYRAEDSNLKKILNSNRILELLSNKIIDLSNPGGVPSDSDSDDDIVLAAKAITQFGQPNVGETEEEDQVKECKEYTRDQILKKHSDKFSLHSQTDFEGGIFTCNLCNSSWPQQYLLQQHMYEHVCEYCNTFFNQRESIQSHKEDHRREVRAKLKYEAESLRLGWRNIVSSESSDSGGDEEDDGFLSELENVLDCKVNNRININSLQTLSHDEIILANKKTFERYSCIDSASSIFACTICKRKYARPTTLTRHFKTHVCPYCNQFFEDKADLLEHKYKHRKEAFANSTDFSTSKKKMPSSPMVTKVNRELFKKFSFVDSARNLNRCTLCCKNFVRRTVLTRHMKTHICSHCDKFFEDKYDLAKHVNTIRSDLYFSEGEQDEYEYEEEDEQPFSGHSAVGDRTKLVSIPSAFSNGLTHFTPAFNPAMSGENPGLAFIQIPATEGGGEAAASQMYTTTPGGSTFQIISEPDTNPESFLVAPTDGAGVDPSKLITIPQPQIVPDDNDDRQRLYECEECGKRFYKSAHLKSHMLMHSGDKPFACRLCGKSFSRSATLRKHEKTHLKRCKICDSTFSYKYELDMHMEIHRTYAFYK